MTGTAAPTVPGEFVRRPRAVSSVVAVIAGVVALGLVGDTTVQRQVLVATLVGVSTFVLGGRTWKRGHVAVGVVLTLCGAVLLVVALGAAATQPAQVIHRLELLPGVLGLWILGAALVPVRFRWSRPLIDVGTGLLFVGVLTSGVVRGSTTVAIVGAATATVLAWDAAENAVSVGGQIGGHGSAATGRAELVHVGCSAGVAGGAIAVVLGVNRLGIDGLSLAALVALLVAGVVLVLVSHR